VAGTDLRLLQINTRPKQPFKEPCIKPRISLRIHQHDWGLYSKRFMGIGCTRPAFQSSCVLVVGGWCGIRLALRALAFPCSVCFPDHQHDWPLLFPRLATTKVSRTWGFPLLG